MWPTFASMYFSLGICKSIRRYLRSRLHYCTGVFVSRLSAIVVDHVNELELSQATCACVVSRYQCQFGPMLYKQSFHSGVCVCVVWYRVCEPSGCSDDLCLQRCLCSTSPQLRIATAIESDIHWCRSPNRDFSRHASGVIVRVLS